MTEKTYGAAELMQWLGENMPTAQKTARRFAWLSDFHRYMSQLTGVYVECESHDYACSAYLSALKRKHAGNGGGSSCLRGHSGLTHVANVPAGFSVTTADLNMIARDMAGCIAEAKRDMQEPPKPAREPMFWAMRCADLEPRGYLR